MANEASKFTMADGTDVSIVDSRIGDLTTTGITGSTVAAQLKELNSNYITVNGKLTSVSIINSSLNTTFKNICVAVGTAILSITYSGYYQLGIIGPSFSKINFADGHFLETKVEVESGHVLAKVDAGTASLVQIIKIRV